MKVFVSQPTKDRTQSEMNFERIAALSFAPGYFGMDKEDIVEVPMIEPRQLSGQHPVYCLGLNLQMMCQADAVLFVPGWWESRACCMEHDVCEQYGIRHVDMVHFPTERQRSE